MATDYYVSLTGSDAAGTPGTITQPFRTLQRGANALAAGDTLYIRGGTYVERVTFSTDGTLNAKITVRGYPNETVTIDGNNQLPTGTYGVEPDPKYGAMIKVTGNDVEIHDLAVTRSRGRGLQVSSVTAGVLIDNVDVSSSYGAGIHVLESDNVTVQNSELWDNNNCNAVHESCRPWGYALANVESDFTMFKNNEVHENHGEGVGSMLSNDLTVEGNVVWDNYAINIYIDNTKRATVQRNIVYATDNDYFFRNDPLPTVGIAVNNEDDLGSTNFTDRIVVVNNFVYNTGGGFTLYGGMVGSDFTNSTIAHNTFVSTRTGVNAAGVTLNNLQQPGAVRTGNVLKNNIVYLVEGTEAQGVTTGFTVSHNNWSDPSNLPVGFQNANDVAGDPLLDLDTGWHPSKEWMMLSSSASPVIDEADPLSGVPEDFFGDLRDSSPDIGADEFSEPPPPPTSNLLSNPGFETTSNWTNYPAANAEQNTTPHSGSYALKLRDVGGFPEVYQQVGVTPGQVYQASVWASTWSSDGLSRGQMRLQWYQGATPLGAAINVTATGSAYAQLSSGNITAPTGSTHLRMTLRRSASLAGNYYFDDAAISSTNLLANPGFETTSSWTNYPAANAEQNTSGPHSGTYQLKLRDAGAGFVDVYQVVSVTPAQVYQASVWGHTWSSDGLSRGQMSLQWYQGATPIGSPINVNATVEAWQQLSSGNITAPAGATNLRMTLRRSAALAGNYYFDDAEIK